MSRLKREAFILIIVTSISNDNRTECQQKKCKNLSLKYLLMREKDSKAKTWSVATLDEILGKWKPERIMNFPKRKKK